MGVMFQALLLIVIFVTSGVGVVAVLRRINGGTRENPNVRTAATIGGIVIWLALWLLTWMEPRLDTERLGNAGCTSSSENDETLKDPVVLVSTRLGGDYVAIDASKPGHVRIEPQVTGGYATVDLATGKTSAMADGGQIWLCDGTGR